MIQYNYNECNLKSSSTCAPGRKYFNAQLHNKCTIVHEGIDYPSNQLLMDVTIGTLTIKTHNKSFSELFKLFFVSYK